MLHQDGNAVDHPPHYNTHPSGLECIEVIAHMNFHDGSAVKYLWRADEKGCSLEDLNKALFYIDAEHKYLTDRRQMMRAYRTTMEAMDEIGAKVYEAMEPGNLAIALRLLIGGASPRSLVHAAEAINQEIIDRTTKESAA